MLTISNRSLPDDFEELSITGTEEEIAALSEELAPFLSSLGHEVIEPKTDEEISIPHKVVGLTLIQGHSMIRAWREYLSFSQEAAAEKLDMPLFDFVELERPGTNPGVPTLMKIAEAFGIEWEQLQI